MNSSEPTVIRLRSVGRRFGRTWALAHIDLDVDRGESVLLAGANGSGKTTLLRMLAGLLRPTRGTLSVCGLDPTRNVAELKQQVTLVSHQSYLYDGLTAWETLKLWNDLLPQRKTPTELRTLLEWVGLSARSSDLVNGFSAGMRKRLTLARSRLEPSTLVLFDEPFAALDPQGQQTMVEWMTRLPKDGKTVLIASHALAQARKLANHALILQRGQISWRGRAEKLPLDLSAESAPTEAISSQAPDDGVS